MTAQEELGPEAGRLPWEPRADGSHPERELWQQSRADAREVWRLCTRHPGYLVSSHGRVRRIGGGILKPWPNPRGYLYVDLGKTRRGQPVHQLVAEAFLGPRPPGCEPDHEDHDRTNNAADNLRWWHRLVNAVRWADRVDGRNVWETPDSCTDERLPPMTDEERAELDRSLAEWEADALRAVDRRA